MATNPLRLQQAYGIGNSLQQLSPFTIIANRAPTTSDKARLGTLWDYKTNTAATDAVYMLTSVTGGQSNWKLLSNNGGAGAFTSLTVTGPITQTAGNVSIGADAAAQTIAIGTGAAVKGITIGSATAGSTLALVGGGAVQVATVDCQSNLVLSTAGTKLIVNGGAVTDFIGTAVLVGGTVAVANTNIAANDRIFLSVSLPGGTQGFLSYAINAGVDFTITSTNALDTSTVAYFIVRQI